jgi:hypothetical protein
MVRLLGIDPRLRFTGWGLIDVDGCCCAAAAPPKHRDGGDKTNAY